MSPEEAAENFVEHIAKNIFEETFIDLKETLEGKHPKELDPQGKLVTWYSKLDEENKSKALELLRLAVDSATFYHCTLMSGSSSPDWEQLEIVVKEGDEEVTWDPGMGFLNSAYRGEVPPWGPELRTS